MNESKRIERRISLHDLRVLMSAVQAGSMGKAAKLLATSSLLFQDRFPNSNTRSAFGSLIAAPTGSSRRSMAVPF
jgi:hypothetical protein